MNTSTIGTANFTAIRTQNSSRRYYITNEEHAWYCITVFEKPMWFRSPTWYEARMFIENGVVMGDLTTLPEEIQMAFWDRLFQ